MTEIPDDYLDHVARAMFEELHKQSPVPPFGYADAEKYDPAFCNLMDAVNDWTVYNREHRTFFDVRT